MPSSRVKGRIADSGSYSGRDGLHVAGRPNAEPRGERRATERACADHQNILRHISQLVEERGGSWFYNKSVDLYAKVGEKCVLVGAKSLANPARAVNRMRYAMGQLFDYRVRYEAEVAGAEPVLAFGTPPERRDAWIATILEGNGVALVGLIDGSLRALNPRAERLTILQ